MQGVVRYQGNIHNAMLSNLEAPRVLRNFLKKEDFQFIGDERCKSERVLKNNGILNFRYEKGSNLEKWLLKKVFPFENNLIRHGGSFVETPEPFHAHADTGKEEEMKGDYFPYKNILIPLCEGHDAFSTVFFNQRLIGQASHLWRGEYYKDKLPLYNFKVDEYSGLHKYTGKEFDEVIHKELLSHLPIDSLFGLSLDSVMNWKKGDVIIFDCSQLHCSSDFKKYGLLKKSLTMFCSKRIAL